MKAIYGLLVLLLLLSNTANAARAKTPVILIDPGHGGIDGGTQSGDGKVLEKDLNLQIATRLAKQLKQEGFHVELTRDTDEDTTKFAPTNRGWGRHKRDLFGRVEAARQKHATILISIHGNHGTTSDRGGVVYYQKSSIESYLLANQLQNRLNGVSNKFHIPRQGNYYILRTLNIPSVLVEYGYLSNPNELANLLDQTYQQKLAETLREGIWYFITFYHLPKN